MRKGLAVSPGVVVGTAYCVPEIFVGAQHRVADDAQARRELNQFEEACGKTATDLRNLYFKVAKQVGTEEAAIFRSHETIVHDPAFHAKMRRWIIEERHTATSALERVLNDYTNVFSRTGDNFLKERVADLRDVIVRIGGHLSEYFDPSTLGATGPIVLVANELLPSHVVSLGGRDVAGIVTQRGGRTSHAAILARSRGIPAVSGVRGLLRQVSNGDLLVVDGRDGNVIVNPSSEVEKAYRKLQREFVLLKDTLAENRSQPAVSADGQTIELLANINHLDDTKAASAMGASGVGLYRTEYLYLTHSSLPDEEEQYEAYRKVINASPNRRVTIRTLDLGGDKTIPFLGHDREANPFMGWRSIRLSFEHPEVFMTQIRAVLRAAATEGRRARPVRLMFPMITTLEEMRRVRAMVHRARRQLIAARKPHADLPIGLMLEVPAAAVMIEEFLKDVDFVSIGSNDLVQYLMAADRDNPKVSHLCQPLSLPVLRVLSQVIGACRRAGKPVTLCGEMAGAPRAFVLLFGMGLRSFSMSPAFIPSIKELLSHLTQPQAERILAHALELKTTGHILRYMQQQVRAICPNLTILDSA